MLYWPVFVCMCNRKDFKTRVKRLTSPHNKAFLWAKRVSERPQIDESGRMTVFVEGEKLLREAMRSNAQLRSLFVLEGHEASWSEYEDCAYIIPQALMKKLSEMESQASVSAIVTLKANVPLIEKLATARTVVILDRIQDPGNVGTIIRSCEALDADALILLRGSCSIGNSKVLRAAMGSAFRFPIYSYVDFQPLLLNLRSAGFALAAADLAGRILWQRPWPPKCALVFGNEGHGLAEKLLEVCDEKVNIPIKNGVESLNVAASVAICLYERMRSCS